MLYTLNLLRLVIAGEITLRTFNYAFKSKPIAVCGKHGSYQVDPHDLNL